MKIALLLIIISSTIQACDPEIAKCMDSSGRIVTTPGISPASLSSLSNFINDGLRSITIESHPHVIISNQNSLFPSYSISGFAAGIGTSIVAQATAGMANIALQVALSAVAAAGSKLKDFIKGNPEYRAEIAIRIAHMDAPVIDDNSSDAALICIKNLSLRDLELMAENEERQDTGCTYFRDRLYKKRVELGYIAPHEY